MNSLMKNRNIGIDLLRGLSILYIVAFWHMFNYTKAMPEYNNFITHRLTSIVLGTFVFISGYFIGLKDITINQRSMVRFYQIRLIRIYPLYLIAICLFTFLNLSDLKTSTKSVFLISSLIGPSPSTLWFITMLMLFYGISPFLIHASRTIKTSTLIMYYLVFIMALLSYSYCTKMLDDRVVLYFPSFAFGVFVGSKDMPFHGKIYVTCAIVSTIFGILVSFIKTPYSALNLIMNIPMVFSCSFFLFGAAKEFAVSSDRVCKNIVLLSYSSYCMYLFHRPIYISLTRIYFPEAYLYQVVYLVVFCLPCILLSSFIIQKTYDITMDTLTNKVRL